MNAMSARMTATPPSEVVRTARITGLWYLGLGVAGVLGFMVVRDRIFVPDDPIATLANVTGRESLARLGVALEIGIALTQALTAVWFYRLFRTIDAWLAGALAAFGLANAVTIAGSAALLATTIEVANENTLNGAGETAAIAQLLYVTSANFWGVGSIFFGLWLIPMGYLVLRSGWMPRPLAWTLLAGAAGLVTSAFVTYLVPTADTSLLTLPATVAEFWTIGYLVAFGVRARKLRQ
jgi:hypothetical protein